MSELEELVRISTDLETFFKERYGATGNGLMNLYNSIRNRIPRKCYELVKYISLVRNVAVHQNPDVAIQHIGAVRAAANRIYELCGFPYRYPDPAEVSDEDDFTSYFGDLETQPEDLPLPTDSPSPTTFTSQPAPQPSPTPYRPTPTPQPGGFAKFFDFLTDWFEKGCSCIIVIVIILVALMYLLSL